MSFIEHFEVIMRGWPCDFNKAIQMYQRGTCWED